MFDHEPSVETGSDAVDLLTSMSWFGAFGVEGARRQRAAFDAVLYDIDGLNERERSVLAAQRPKGGDILVVHPGGVRGVGVYRSIGDFAMSIDALARVAAAVGPGVAPLGAAAFARTVADALSEPVIVVAPTYSAADMMRDLSFGVFAHSILGARRSPEAAELSQLLVDPRFRIGVAVAHSTGGWTLSEALFAARETLRRDGTAQAGATPRVVTFGGAVTTPRGVEARHVIGALDGFGWALSDPNETVTLSPQGAGHHVNLRWPSALDVAAALREMAPELVEQGRSRRWPETARHHD